MTAGKVRPEGSPERRETPERKIPYERPAIADRRPIRAEFGNQSGE